MSKTHLTPKYLKLFTSYSNNALHVLLLLKPSFGSVEVFGDKDWESESSSGFSLSLTSSLSSLSHLIFVCNSKSLCKILSLNTLLYLKRKFWERLLHLHRNHSIHQLNCCKNFLLHHWTSSLQKWHELRLVLIEFSFFHWNYMKQCFYFRPFSSTPMFTFVQNNVKIL